MFKEFYYWLYELLKKIKTNDNPEFNAYLGISSFQFLNVLTLVGITNFFFALDVSEDTAIYLSIFIYVSITAVNFFSLFRKREKIIKKYEKLPVERQRKGKLYLWIYMLTTTGLSMYVIINLVTPKY